MTHEQTLNILRTITANWPAFLNGRDAEITARIWDSVFADDDFDTVGKALLMYISSDTKGFPPTPGQIRALVAERTAGAEDGPDDLQAWALVRRAVNNAVYHGQEEFDRLPACCREVLGGPAQLRAWALMDEREVESVVASNFMRSYRARQEQRRRLAVLPRALREGLPGAETPALPPPKAETPALPEPDEPVPMPDFFRERVRELLGKGRRSTAL